jgi:hypothetical protein
MNFQILIPKYAVVKNGLTFQNLITKRHNKFKTREKQKPIWLNIVYLDVSVDPLPFSRKTI